MDNLPAETRNQIPWYLVPTNQTFTMRFCNGMTCHKDRIVEHAKYAVSTFFHSGHLCVDRCDHGLRLQILTMSKAIAEECLQLLYGSNTFGMRDGQALVLLVKTLPESNLRRIRHLMVKTTLDVCLWPSYTTHWQHMTLDQSRTGLSIDDIGSPTGRGGVLTGLVNLQTLRILHRGDADKVSSLDRQLTELDKLRADQVWKESYVRLIQLTVNLPSNLRGGDVYRRLDEHCTTIRKPGTRSRETEQKIDMPQAESAGVRYRSEAGGKVLDV